MRHDTSDPQRHKAIRKGPEDKIKMDARSYLAALEIETRAAMRSGFDKLKQATTQHLLNPAYWTQAHPIASVSTAAAAGFAVSAFARSQIETPIRKRAERKLERKRAEERQIARQKAQRQAYIKSVLDPVMKNLIGAASTSALSYFVGKYQERKATAEELADEAEYAAKPQGVEDVLPGTETPVGEIVPPT